MTAFLAVKDPRVYFRYPKELSLLPVIVSLHLASHSWKLAALVNGKGKTFCFQAFLRWVAGAVKNRWLDRCLTLPKAAHLKGNMQPPLVLYMLQQNLCHVNGTMPQLSAKCLTYNCSTVFTQKNQQTAVFCLECLAATAFLPSENRSTEDCFLERNPCEQGLSYTLKWQLTQQFTTCTYF